MRLQTVDFSDPAYGDVHEVFVSGPGAPKLERIEDLAGQEVYARPSSSYFEHLLELNRRFREQGLEPIKVMPANENLETEDLLQMVNAGLFGITIARPGSLHPCYTYGAILLAAPAWASGTALGIVAGNLLPLRAVGVALGMHLAQANDVSFALPISTLYGAFSGVFAARAARLWRLAMAQERQLLANPA